MTKPYIFLIVVVLFFLTSCNQSMMASFSPTVVFSPPPQPETLPTRAKLAPTLTPSAPAEVVTEESPVRHIMASPTATRIVSTKTAVVTITHPTPTPMVQTTLYPVPAGILLNGLSPDTFLYFPPEVIDHTREILAAGQTMGRDLHRFSKIGDSIVDTPQFFVPFDTGDYLLGDYQYLGITIEHYSGSYSRFGVALRDGLSSTSVMDPMWANKEQCQANETPLACEIRVHNPSLLLIHFGTNDWTVTFEANMRQIIEQAIEQGIVPILITKANRIDANNERNDILRTLASEYQIPLWDFDIIAETLPERGLAQDNAHLSISPEFNYSTAELIPQGYKAFNLSGLMLLHRFLGETSGS